MKSRVRELRQGRELTQQKLADALSVGRQTVNSMQLAFNIAVYFESGIGDVFLAKKRVFRRE